MEINGFDTASRCLIIAELSANHNGSKQIALDTVKAAADCGADAIKLQTFTPDTITLDSKRDEFKIQGGTLWDGRYLYELYQEASTPWEWHQEIFEEADKHGLLCFSSPFDKTAIDFLEGLNTPAYKIASFEIHDIPLIAYAASKGKPIIISTGIADEEDIRLALQTCRNEGNDQIALLKCTSSYPAPIDLANMKTMADMRERFNVEVGLSDHTIGNIVPLVAVSMGAMVIEKHFILDKALGGPDAAFSLNPAEFTSLVEEVRMAEMALGKVSYELTEKTIKSRRFGRSLFVAEDMKAGEVITEENVRSVRPSTGLHPKYLKDLIGQKVNKNLEKGTPMSWGFVDSLNPK